MSYNTIKPPFFEIGPKAFFYGKELLELAKAAQEASVKYNVDIIFTPQVTDIALIAQNTKNLYVFAQHMDALRAGRGLGSILPEAVKNAGAKGVMLNHAECPLQVSVLRETIERAKETELITIVCADSPTDAAAIAQFAPHIIVAEPTELIGTGQKSDMTYVMDTIKAIKAINPQILVLQGAGISSPEDVYEVIYAGAEATGTTSGIMKAKDPIQMTFDMIKAVREAFDARQK